MLVSPGKRAEAIDRAIGHRTGSDGGEALLPEGVREIREHVEKKVASEGSRRGPEADRKRT